MTDIKNDRLPVFEAYPYLPKRISGILNLFCMKYPRLASEVTEIRLRLNGALSVSAADKNVVFDETGNLSGPPYICTKEDLDGCAALLCRTSFHSHRDELERGYISSSGRVRAGVSTYGVLGGPVYGIDGICIRIPREIRGCSVKLLEETGVV